MLDFEYEALTLAGFDFSYLGFGRHDLSLQGLFGWNVLEQ